MLFLIRAHGDQIRLIEQNIRRHQDGIGKQSGGDIVRVLLGFLLELRHTPQFAELGIAAQNPAQFGVLGDVALNKEDILFRGQAAGDILRQLFQRSPPQLRRFLADRDGMQIHNTVDAVIFLLQRDPAPESAHIRPQRQFPARLNTAENFFLFHISPCFHLLNCAGRPNRAAIMIIMINHSRRSGTSGKIILSCILSRAVEKRKELFQFDAVTERLFAESSQAADCKIITERLLRNPQSGRLQNLCGRFTGKNFFKKIFHTPLTGWKRGSIIGLAVLRKRRNT